MTNEQNEQKARNIVSTIFERSDNKSFYEMAVESAMQMGSWKDEQIAFALSFLKPRLSANEYAIVCDRLNFRE